MTNLPLEELKAIRRAPERHSTMCTWRVCSGALRRYLSDRGELPERPLVASVPVSTDPDAARMSGNRVDNLYVCIGTDIADPLERLQHIHEGAGAAKEVRERARPRSPRAAGRRRPASDRSRHRADMEPVAHRRPGTPTPQCGAFERGRTSGRILFGPIELEALYSVGPILEGIGLNITAWSYERCARCLAARLPGQRPRPLADHRRPARLPGRTSDRRRRGRPSRLLNVMDSGPGPPDRCSASGHRRHGRIEGSPQRLGRYTTLCCPDQAAHTRFVSR